MAPRTKTPPTGTIPGLPGLPQQKDRNPILVVGGAIVRAIGNIVVIAALAAAGLGGWFAADEYLIPRLEGSVAASVSSTWPSELGGATPWPVYETNWIGAQGDRTSVIFEPETNTVVAASIEAPDAPGVLVEWSGPLLAMKPGDEPWQVRAGIEEQANPRRLLADRIVSPRLADVLVGRVADHSIVREVTGQGVGTADDAEIGIVRWFEVTVDADAFRRDDPTAFGRSHPRVSDRVGVFTWTIGTDDDGRIMRWDGIVEGASVSMRPVELPELQSPIATQVALARDAANDAPADGADPTPPAEGSVADPVTDVEPPAPADGSIVVPADEDDVVPPAEDAVDDTVDG